LHVGRHVAEPASDEAERIVAGRLGKTKNINFMAVLRPDLGDTVGLILLISPISSFDD